MIIALVLLLGMTVSCEDQLDEVSPITIIKIEYESLDSDIERERPGQN